MVPLLWLLLVGLLAGLLAYLLAPDRQPEGLSVPVRLGITASVVGGLAATVLTGGLQEQAYGPPKVIVASVIAAATVLLTHHRMSRQPV